MFIGTVHTSAVVLQQNPRLFGKYNVAEELVRAKSKRNM